MNRKQRIGIISFFTAIILILMCSFACAKNVNGVDVSNNNGYINFSSFTQNGINNVIIKATEGVDYVDVNLNSNYNKAKILGMNIGFYHFFSNYTSPTQQAIDFWNAIKDKQFNITPVLDIETNRLGVPKSLMTQRALEFLTKFKEISGYDCMIYSYTSFIEEDLDYYSLINYKLWVANYSSSPRYPSAWSKNYAGWQNSEDFYINGKRYDSNIFTDLIYCNTPNSIVDANTYNINNFATDNIYLQLQRELNAQGFRDKNGNKLVEDGIPGELTLSACPLVKKGASGNITTWIQLRCGATPDGIFGTDTENAVKWMQRKWNINDDGIVGPNTWAKLLGL